MTVIVADVVVPAACGAGKTTPIGMLNWPVKAARSAGSVSLIVRGAGGPMTGVTATGNCRPATLTVRSAPGVARGGPETDADRIRSTSFRVPIGAKKNRIDRVLTLGLSSRFGNVAVWVMT